MSRNITINDPFFNEYVYHCIVSSSAEARNKLPTALLKFTYSKERIKRFADKASLEQKIEMLSRLGISSALFFSTPEHLLTEELTQAYNNYKADRNYDTVKGMIKHKQFVFTSRDVMAVLGIMGQNCHSSTYMLDREYSRVAVEISNFGEIKKKKDADLIRPAMEQNKMLVKLLLHNLENQTFVDVMTAYKTVDLEILMFLFLRMDKETTTYTPLKKIQEYFRANYNGRAISTTLTGLYRTHHVQRFPARFDYAISELGIQTLFAYLSRLINNVLSR